MKKFGSFFVVVQGNKLKVTRVVMSIEKKKCILCKAAEEYVRINGQKNIPVLKKNKLSAMDIESHENKLHMKMYGTRKKVVSLSHVCIFALSVSLSYFTTKLFLPFHLLPEETNRF